MIALGYMATTQSDTPNSQRQSETRCECGQLIAKVRGQGLELKCKRCKRIVVIPFSSIEGWTAQTPVV
jgi:phage FluMu protein Com